MSIPERFRGERARVAITLSSATILLAGILAVFWFQDVRYSRPTPLPANFAPPPLASVVPLPIEISGAPRDARPIVLHFFNQDCPCSRFNVDQARALADEYRGQVRFVLVLQSDIMKPEAQRRALSAAEKKFGGVEGIVDVGGKIAERYGVYATPQAVILFPDGELAYRGNYNVSRYCNDPTTEFARIALEAVIAGHLPASLPELAYKAYGCELPQTALR